MLTRTDFKFKITRDTSGLQLYQVEELFEDGHTVPVGYPCIGLDDARNSCSNSVRMLVDYMRRAGQVEESFDARVIIDESALLGSLIAEA